MAKKKASRPTTPSGGTSGDPRNRAVRGEIAPQARVPSNPSRQHRNPPNLGEPASEAPSPANEFRQLATKFPSWWSRSKSADVVYALPQPLIDQIAPSKSDELVQQEGLISAEDAAAERELSELCARTPCVGFWRISGMPLEFKPMEPEFCLYLSNARINPEPRESRSKIEIYIEIYVEQTRLGYAGWLTANQDYRSELEGLRQHWEEQRPQANGNSSMPPVPARISDSPNEFENRYFAFLEKWGLEFLATWELPLPLVPHIGSALTIAEYAGPQAEVFFFPNYFPVRSDKTREGVFAELIRQLQGSQAEERGHDKNRFPVSGIASRNGRPGEFAQAFAIWLAENTVRNRYSISETDGLVGRICTAFHALWGQPTTEQIGKNRNNIPEKLRCFPAAATSRIE